MQEKIGNVSGVVELFLKSKRKFQKSKTKINNAFRKLISRLDTVRERISELGHRSIKTSQTKTQTDYKEKKKKNNNRISKVFENETYA